MDETKDGDATTVSTMRATAHPVRLRILSLLTGAEMSAAEVARELGITHANASYHLRTLADAGLVVEAGETKIRGGVAKRYRHPWDSEALMHAPVSPEDSDRYIRVMAQEMVRRHGHRRSGGGRGNLTDAELWVAPETYERVSALVHEASLLLHREARPPRSEGTVPVAMTAALFLLQHDAAAEEDGR
jgi:DNA-binding transcriptional ArsR family regulator